MISFQDLVQQTNTGASANDFFKLKNGEEVQVRFAYGNINDFGAYAVHQFDCPQKNPILVQCSNESNSQEATCPYCEKGMPRLLRVVIAVYRLDTNTIQYWTKTNKWFMNNFVPLISELQGQVCSQVYKIKRTGDGLDTTYTIIPVGQPDNTTVDMLGKLKDPITDLKAIKTCDFAVPAGFTPYMGQSAQPQPQFGAQSFGTNYNPNYNNSNYNNQQYMTQQPYGSNLQQTQQPFNTGFEGPQYTGQQATRRTTALY